MPECPLCGTPPSLVYADRSTIAAELAMAEEFFARRMEIGFSRDELRDVTNVLLATPAEVLRCATCGMLIRNDALDADAFRGDSYDDTILAALHETHVRAFREKEPDYRALLPAGARVAEVGSYVGGFLAAAAEWGWSATGIDVGSDPSRFCRAMGFDARCGSFDDAAFADASLDAVFIWNCFEQIVAPRPLLDAIHRALRPDGLLVIRVPDADFYVDQHDALQTEAREPAIARLAYDALLGWPYRYGYSALNLERLAREHGFALDRVLRRPAIRALCGAMSEVAKAEESALRSQQELGWIELTFHAHSVEDRQSCLSRAKRETGDRQDCLSSTSAHQRTPNEIPVTLFRLTQTYGGRRMNVLKVGKYRVLQHLGGGGSSEVYLAEDTLMRRKVALKVLRHRDADARQLRHFEREVQAAAMINHPNIVTVFDMGVDSEVQYIATEYVEGETLRQRMARGPIPVTEVLDIAIGVANALVAAHESWIVHRDVKPENIMLRRDNGVKVLDFGVATLAGGGDGTDPLRRPLLGTLYYLSPEQVRGEPIIDTRSDIFSLGVVLYEMLADRPPFDGETPIDILAAIVEKQPAPLPSFVPLALHEIVAEAMRKNMYERTQTASLLLEQLRELRFETTMRERGIV